MNMKKYNEIIKSTSIISDCRLEYLRAYYRERKYHDDPTEE